MESYRYDAFGNLILGFSKNAGKQSTLPGAKNEQRNTNQQDSKMWLKNDRLYTSRELDEELRLYYYRGRHYDPRIGRFIQRDPIDMVGESRSQYMKEYFISNNIFNAETIQELFTCQ